MGKIIFERFCYKKDKIFNLLFNFCFVFCLFFGELVYAQPGAMSINQDVSGTYSNTSMTLVGGAFRARFQENGTGTSAGTRNWQFNADGYFNQWGATAGAGVQTLSSFNSVISPNTGTASANFYTSGYNSNGRLPATQANHFYTYNIIRGTSYASQRMSILETSYNPISVSSIAQSVGTFGSRTITITTSATPASGENIFVRFSTNSFASSTIVQATGSGTTWTASIPWQSSAVSFYIYTSNRTKAAIDSDVTALSTQEVHDLSSLSVNNNGGANYSWTPVVGNFIVTSAGGTFASGIGYTSLTNASGVFAALNTAAAGTGAVTILQTGNSTAEAGTNALNASSNWTSITLNPLGARTISGTTGTVAPLQLIDFSGADNVTINGLNTGGNSLTISNLSIQATSGTSTIRFIGGATNNTITNCNILGSSTMAVGTNGGTIFFSTDAVTANGNDSNTISNCNIGPAVATLPTKAIYGNGSTSTTAIGNSGNIITNNNIYDYFGAGTTSSGIYINAGCNTWTISNNKFYQTATRTWTTGNEHNAINIQNTTATSGAQGFTVTGNAIGFANSASTGTYTLTGSTGTFRGIRYNGISSGTTTDISNNTIANISVTGVTSSGSGSSSPFTAIFINNGLVTTNGNTIGSQSATGSIVYTTSTTTATEVNGIYNFSVDAWTSNNNLIGGLSITNSSTGNIVLTGLRANTNNTSLWTANSNTIGGTVANSIQLSASGASSQVMGMQSANAPMSFTSNTIRNLTTNVGTGTTVVASVIGICLNSTATINSTLSQNTIFSLTNTNTTAASVVTGIQFTGASANTVSRNFIFGLSVATNSTGAEVNGIRIAGGTTVYSNNMIALGSGVSNAIGGTVTNSSTTGINGINGAAGTDSFFNNSVYIGGTATAGTGASYAFNSTVASGTRSFRNNIFVNNRTNSGATGKHYVIKINGTAVNPSGLTLNNNLYFGNGTGNVFGFYNSADVASLSAWQTAVGHDAGSFNSDPAFVDPTGATPDLHINSVTPTAIEGTGVDLGVALDYDGQTRSGLTPVDIGADAGNFTPSVAACTTPANQPTAFVNGTNTATGISGSFTAAAGTPTGYIVIRSSGAFTGTLVDGTSYTAGGTIGNGTVIQVGNATSFSASSLVSNTAYTITVFSYNSGDCTGGPKYLITSPLTSILTTCPVAPTAFVNSAITSSSATISWTASAVGGSAATINYTLEVYTDSGYTTPISGSPFSVGSAVTYGLAGLSSATTYYYRAKANNGSCDSVYLSSGVVTTACNAEAAPTVVQTFATFTGIAPNPVCWSEATGAVGAPSTLSFVNSEWLNSTGFANSGTNVGVKTNLYNTNPGEWIISNQIDLGSTPGLYRLRYDMAVTSYNGTAVQSTLGTHIVRVIISTDGGTTWSNANTIKTYTGAGSYSNTGQTEYINLTGYSGIVKIAFVATTTSTTPDIDFHIDNFGVELLPACANAPASVAATTNITTSTATLNWTAASTTPGNSYEYYYSTSNTAPNSGTTASGNVGPTTLTADITGLTAATTYYFWVRSDCDGTNKSSWTGSGTFVTACTTPNNPSAPVFSAVSSTGLTLNFTAASPVPTAYVVFRSTSNVPPTPLNGTAYVSGTSYTFSSVSYTCVANGTSTTVTQTGLTGNTNYYYYIFSRDNANSCSGAPWYSSGISASQITCPAAPTTFVTSGISSSGATVSWTASAGGTDATVNYILEVYTDAGFTTPIAASPFAVGPGVSYALTGLSASTTYYYRVKANNGICDSAYLSGGTFSTACNSISSFPSVEPFATYLPTVCWNEGDLGNLTTGPATIGGSATSDWIEDGYLNVGTTGCAKMNIDAANGSEWLLTPFYSIPATGYRIKYNVGATQWNTTTALTTAWEADDFVELLVSVDNSNWTVLKTYNSTSVPSHLGQVDVIDISSYGGQTVRFAFRAFEGTTNGSADIDFFVDNFTIELIPDPINIAASAGTTICNGNSTELTASSTTAYNYTWSPATGLNTTNGATVIANPSVTTTYTITGTLGAIENTQTVTITVNPSPANVVLTPSNSTVCSNTITLMSASSLLNNTITVGTSSGTSVAATTPYRQGVTTQARMQYLITKAELNALGINSAASLTSLGFNVTSAGTGTIPTYTIGMANTTATALTSTFLTPTFTTVFSTTNYVVTTGVNTHNFTTPFAWDGNSNIVVNICMAGVAVGTNSTVSTSNQAVISTATLNGSSSCSGATANNTNLSRPIMFIGTSVNNAITWSPFTGLFTDSGATTAYAGEVLSSVYARPTTTTTYTATATIGSCTKTASTTLTVDTAPVAGTVSSNQALCTGSTPADITLTGSSGAIQWQSSSNNTTFNPISGATSSTLLGTTIGALTSTQYYRAIVSNGICTSATSPVVTVVVSTPVDFANLQFPSSGAICAGNSFTAYGQVYESGVTEAAGAGSGITVEFGYHTANTNPSTWTNWSTATFNSQQGNNDEYLFNFTPSVAGTYFYTFRYKQGACDWQYGGFNGGFWNGTSNTNGTLTVSEQPTTAAAGGDQIVCEGATINLSANSAVVGSGSWSVVSGVGGSFASASNPTTTFTGNANTVYTLRWTISNGACTASTDDVTITIQRGNLDYYNLQTPSATICEGSTFDAYGQVYELGITEAVGSGNGIEVQFGYHTSNTNPNTWTTWSATGVAYFGQSGIGNNNDEFKVTTGAALTSGTYYYTFRYRINGCDWYYGGYSATGGGAWNGSSNISGILTINALPSAAISANSGSTACAGSNVSFTISGTADAVVTYNINGGDNTTATLVGGTAIITINGAATTQILSLIAVAKNGCTVGVNTSSTITINTVIWDGNSWSNVTGPLITDTALISGNYSSSENGGDISACSLTITNNAVVIISSNHTVNLNGALNVETGSSFTLENNANLLQGGATNTNSGAITVKRNSSLLKRLDYTLWSSPVAGQNLLTFSPQTISNRFYTYNSTTNFYESVASPATTNFETAKGYLIRIPNNHPSVTPTSWAGQFTGVPNNGNYNVTMQDDVAGQRFNLVGNPYPSPIDALALIGNANNSSSITGTLYFWRKTNGSANPSYCTWTGGGFVTNNDAQTFDPNDVIQTGQAFFVEATGTNDQLVFTNEMRVNNTANQFFRNAQATNTVERNRIWLNATSAGGAFSQTMIGYISNASNGLDAQIDGKYINDGDIALTSLLAATPMAIQGRALPFDSNDIVPLRFKATTAGTYTIAIDHTDGLFANGQTVFLRDNVLGVTHNLSDGGYTFAIESGTFDNRFEVVYQSTLGNDTPVFNENQVVVYTNTPASITVDSGNVLMNTIKVFDIRGRLLTENRNINASQAILSVSQSNEVILIQIESVNGETVIKKFVK